MMTKKEFENHKEPLALIVSINPSTGKVLFDTYDFDTYEAWKEEIEEDFPDMITFHKVNKAAIKERKKRFGFTG